ncbi:MAG TPA: hypothetical protein VHU88_11145 [Sporichthyaceae bacterium]|jgi:hypothetical protein|nr:hypothetical protein [Sporichthyaceae bacterium]
MFLLNLLSSILNAIFSAAGGLLGGGHLISCVINQGCTIIPAG